MTRQEQRLKDQQAAVQARIDDLKRRQKRLESLEAAEQRKQTHRRYLQVGKLVEAAGVLWVEDGVLETLLKDAAQRQSCA